MYVKALQFLGSEPEIYRRRNLKRGRGHVIAVAEVDIIEVDRVGHHRGRQKTSDATLATGHHWGHHHLDYVEYRIGRDRHLHRDPLACGDTVSGNCNITLSTPQKSRDTVRQCDHQVRVLVGR